MQSNGFLDLIRSPVRSAGAAQASGARPAGGFMFATGIECSNPTIGQGRIRRDQLEECGHYERWREDLGLVRELGVPFLRYGLPYHRVHRGPGLYDWSFADEAMAEMQRLGITPILDLLHFGVPDWLGNFQNPELPMYFMDYADAVSRRYPWVRYYTPVNEIYVTARISAKDGLWNEQLRSDRAFVTALKHLTAANILSSHSIVRNRPDAVFVHSESAEFIHRVSATPCAETRLANNQRFIALDLLYGRSPDAETYAWLLDNGMRRAEYDWFMAGEPPGHQVVGLDYYGRNEHIVTPTGRAIPAEDVIGWYLMAKEYHRRYRRPLMHAETNVFDAAAAPAWLWKQWINTQRLRADGIPVLGFTWYSLVDQIDWDVALSEMRGTVNCCGLFDLQRRPNPVAAEFRAMVAEFGGTPLMPDGDLAHALAAG